MATALIDDAVAFATTIGIARISVLANPHAAPFYRRVGFVTGGHASTEFGPALRMHLTVPN